jgi:hypothetical protein
MFQLHLSGMPVRELTACGRVRDVKVHRHVALRGFGPVLRVAVRDNMHSVASYRLRLASVEKAFDSREDLAGACRP